MFQPIVKYQFVRRYCNPQQGWTVYVDIDPSEEGRTGGERKTAESKERQKKMLQQAKDAISKLNGMGVCLGGKRSEWFKREKLPPIEGDRDIVAFHRKKKILLIAEVEGASSGQPEQKLYKAIGQLVMAASDKPPRGWKRRLVLVVHGEQIAEKMKKATALKKLGIYTCAIGADKKEEWLNEKLL